MSGKQEFQVGLPDGRSVVVEAKDEAEARTAAQNFLMREKGADRGRQGGVDNFGRSLARGASFGLADEIAAAGDATFGPAVDWGLGKLGWGSSNTSTAPTWGERYDQNLSSERAQDKAYDDNFPVWSTTGKIGGGVAGAVAMLPKAVMAGGTGAAGMVRGGLAGAGLGGVAGFGEGEGGFVDRLGSAGTGAAVGGVLGAAAVPVANTVGTLANAAIESPAGMWAAKKLAPGFNMAADALDSVAPKMPGFLVGKNITPKSLSAAAPEDGSFGGYNWMNDVADRIRTAAPNAEDIVKNAATSRIADALRRGGDDVTSGMATIDRLGEGAMPLDINPMTQRLGRTGYVAPGEAPKVINAAMDARNRGTPTRMVGALGDEANVPSIYDARKFLDANRQHVGATAYGAMDEAGLKQSPALMKLYENPAIGGKGGAIERVMSAEKMSREGTNRAPASPVEIMHEVKRAIQNMGLDPTGRPAPGAKWWNDMADEFVRELKSSNPKLAEADKLYQEAVSLYSKRNPGEGWLARGQNFMASGTGDKAVEASAPAIAAELPGATPKQQMTFKVGATNTLKDKIMAGPKQARAVADSIDTNELLRGKLTEIYGPEVADRLMQRAATELQFAKTDRVVRGGSDTVSKGLSAADEAASGIPTSPQGAIQRAFQKIAEIYNKQRAGNESVRAETARQLTSTDRMTQQQLMEEVQRQIERINRARPVARGVSGAAAQIRE